MATKNTYEIVCNVVVKQVVMGETDYPYEADRRAKEFQNGAEAFKQAVGFGDNVELVFTVREVEIEPEPEIKPEEILREECANLVIPADLQALKSVVE